MVNIAIDVGVEKGHDVPELQHSHGSDREVSSCRADLSPWVSAFGKWFRWISQNMKHARQKQAPLTSPRDMMWRSFDCDLHLDILVLA